MSKKYIQNPKMKGSGMYGCIPQKGLCPNKCSDCFFQSGRSYLEPLDENLPNMPNVSRDKIIRVNDGNDSYFLTPEQITAVIHEYPNCFFNTSIPNDLDKYHTQTYGMPNEMIIGATLYWDNNDLHPVVLTVNPGDITDKTFHKVDPIPKNLMFVRFRANYWNQRLAEDVVKYYSEREVPIVFTWMAYHTIESIPEEYRAMYIYRKRTLNSYYAIKTLWWQFCMNGRGFQDNKWVYSCGKIEGELGDTHCRFCGNCLREFHVCMERLSCN